MIKAIREGWIRPCGCSSHYPRSFANGDLFHQRRAQEYHRKYHISRYTSATKCQQSSSDKEAFIEQQTRVFNIPSIIDGVEATNSNVEERIRRIVSSILPVISSARVIDVGCGTGILIPYLRTIGIQDILGVDLATEMLRRLQERYPVASVCGNDPGVRVWEGDFAMLPDYMGPADVIFFNAVFGNLYCQKDYLIKALSFLQPGGRLVVSHPMGREWHCDLKRRNPDVVLHELPTLDRWETLISDLPLQLILYRNEALLYVAVLQVPEAYTFDEAPIFLKGEVILGRGIGSAKLGVPTANLDPSSFQDALKSRCKGVYFGWAQLEGTETVYPSVFNLGACPTMKSDEEGISLEAHILHKFKVDFYGKTLRVALVGYLRPELKFSGVDALLDQIQTDIGKARNALKEPIPASVRHNAFFL